MKGDARCLVLVIAATSMGSRIPARYLGPGVTPGHLEGNVVAVLISKGANGLILGLGGERRACNVLMAHASKYEGTGRDVKL